MSEKLSKYVIEREVPNAGNLSQKELQEISKKSCDVLRNLGPEIQWIQSYVTQNKLYCVYLAPNEDLIRKHGELGGFPVTGIAEVRSMIDPTSAG